MSHSLNLSNFPPNADTIEFSAHDQYPDVVFTREMLHPPGQSRRTDCTRDMMVPVTESLPKRIMSIFMELGILEALGEATQSESRLVSRAASYLQLVCRRLKQYWQSYPCELSMDLVAKYSQTRNWQKSTIRCIGWHPQCFKLAVATIDDTVRIYTRNPGVTPILRSSQQKAVTCLAWRPFAGGELAIGCQTGVLIWSVDPMSQITRPLSQAVHLQHGRHQPVTAVSWSHNGELLVTASINDTDILAWNVDQQRCVPMHRVKLPCALVSYAPLGFSMIASSVGRDFYICSVPPERAQRVTWSTSCGSLQSFAWSRDEKHLLFVTTDDIKLFYMRLSGVKNASYELACPLVDFDQKVTENGVTIGGKVQAIAWCPRDRFLAVTFKSTAAIALFFTNISGHKINIDPYCLIFGSGVEYPACLCYQENYKQEYESDAQAVLTIGWSSGRVEYYPL
ncbi:aladin-like [Anopheles nili]|uniref:aladin-like n=1 Tax=Anopheles nili TaxID=185578 RepID=UPI00237C2135|nr:aladin-like [Anopheles nili]